MIRTPLAWPLALATALSALLPAQAPVLVRDLDPSPLGNPSSRPEILGQVGPIIILAASVPDHGYAIYGSPLGLAAPQLLAHFLDQPDQTTSIDYVASTATTLYFMRGWDLWCTDGKPAGTRFLAKLMDPPTRPTARVVSAAVSGNRAFFILDHGTMDILWVSAGTPNTTSRVAVSGPAEVATLAGKIYLSARGSAVGQELFTTDGTSAGTKLVADLHPGAPGSHPHAFFVSGGKIFFEATTSGAGSAFWTTDGKTTRLLKDVDGSSVRWTATWPRWTSYGNKVVFTAATGLRDYYSVWISDGTPSGTTALYPKMARNAVPVALDTTPTGILLYVRDASNHELWASDGKPAGTKRIASFSNEVSFAGRSAQRTLFTATAATSGDELWSTDGTTLGTTLVKDIQPGSNGSAPRGFLTNTVGTFFSADDGRVGRELWLTDGTASGTRLVHDLKPIRRTTRSSDAEVLHADSWRAFLTTGPPDRLWATDGSAANTTSLVGLSSPIEGETATLGALSFFGRPIFRGIWVSDGAAAGTRALVPNHTLIGLTAYRGHAWLAAAGRIGPVEIWRSDGTVAGTTSVTRPPAGATTEGRLSATSRGLFYAGTDGIYRFDGIKTHTRIAAASGVSELATHGDRIYFGAQGTTKYVMYEGDGTPSGNRLVQDSRGVRPTPALLQRGTRLGNLFLFFGRTAANGLELWKTGGTTATTGLVKDIRPGSEGGLACSFELRRHGDVALFFADDGASGCELWKTDGTNTGTVQVRDIRPGKSGSVVYRETQIVSAGRYAYFAANDGTNGTELWRTDGTRAGTTMVADLNPGDLPSHPTRIRLHRGRLLFGANDGVVGHELFQLDPGPHSQPIGSGCATGPAPTLAGTIPRIGATLEIRVANASARSGFLAIGSVAGRPAHLGNGCTLHIDFTKPFLPLAFRTNAQGDWTWRVGVPNDPTLHGLLVPLQAGVGPTKTGPLLTDLTNGLLLAVRR